MVLPVDRPVYDPNEISVEAESTSVETASAEPSTSPWPAAWLSILLLCLAISPFVNNRNFQYVGPDLKSIATSVRGGAEASLGQKVTLSITQSSQLLVDVTYNLQSAAGLLSARSVHLIHVGLHLLTALFVFLALCVGLKRWELSLGQPFGSEILAFVVTLLWSVHPLTSETVSYAMHRGELMASMFSAAMVLFHLLGWFGLRWSSLLAVICLALGLACKPTVMLMPLVVSLIEYGVSRESIPQILSRRWLVHTLYGVVTLAALGWGIASGRVQELVADLSWGYVNAQPLVMLNYLVDSVWPAHLCPEFHWPVESATGPSSQAILLLAGSALAIVSPLLFRRAGVILAVLTLLVVPRSLLGLGDAYGEYRMYLPLVMVMLVIVSSINALIGLVVARFELPGVLFRGAATTLVFMSFVVEAVLCYPENQKFANKDKFWESIVKTTPYNPEAFSAVAFNAYKAKELDAAAMGWAKAIQLSDDGDPNLPRYHTLLAQILERKGIVQAAIDEYEIALKQGSFQLNERAELLSLLQKLYTQTNQFDKAKSRLSERLVIYRNLPKFSVDDEGSLLAAHNIAHADSLIAGNVQLPEAERLIDEAIEKNPRFLNAFLSKAKLKQTQGKLEESLAIYNDILSKTPKEIQARFGRTFVLMMTGQQKQGISDLVQLVSEYPQIIDFRRQLAWYLATFPDETIRDPQTALDFAKEVCNAQRKKNAEGIDGKIDPISYSTLAAAAAASGDYELAVSTSDLGIVRALELSMPELAQEIKSRRDLYEQKKPYIEHAKPIVPGAAPAQTPPEPEQPTTDSTPPAAPEILNTDPSEESLIPPSTSAD